MFGIGPQELLIVGLLVLLVFGPTKATSVARDFGRFVSGARSTVEEFKSELVPEEVKDARRIVEEIKDGLAAHKRGIDEAVETEVLQKMALNHPTPKESLSPTSSRPSLTSPTQ